MFCPKCGVNLADNAHRCFHCGAEWDAEGNVQTIPPVPPLVPASSRKSRKKTVIAVTATVLVLALLAGGIGVLWNREKNAASSYYMSRFTMAGVMVEGNPIFDVFYSQDGGISEFRYCDGRTKLVLTPDYDEAGRIQTLTCAAESTNVYQFVYEEGIVPGIDTVGMVGMDPDNPTIRLYYDKDDNLVGIASLQDNMTSTELLLDSQGRIKSYKGPGLQSAQFIYDSHGNLTDLEVTDIIVDVSMLGDHILETLAAYLFHTQFPDFIWWLSIVSSIGFEMDISEISLHLLYDENRLSGATFKAGSDTVTLDMVSASAESSVFSASYKMGNEAGVSEFQTTIQYTSGHISGVDIKMQVTPLSGTISIDPSLISQRQYDAQGNETEVILFYPSAGENGNSVPIAKLQKTWALYDE